MGGDGGHRTPPSSCYHPTPSPLSPYYSDEDSKEKEESDLGRETEMSPATAFFSTGPDTQPECRPSGWAELFPEHRCRPKGSSSVPHQWQGFCGPGSFQIPLPPSLRCKYQISISLDCIMLQRLTFQKLPFERENKTIFCS